MEFPGKRKNGDGQKLPLGGWFLLLAFHVESLHAHVQSRFRLQNWDKSIRETIINKRVPNKEGTEGLGLICHLLDKVSQVLVIPGCYVARHFNNALIFSTTFCTTSMKISGIDLDEKKI